MSVDRLTWPQWPLLLHWLVADRDVASSHTSQPHATGHTDHTGDQVPCTNVLGYYCTHFTINVTLSLQWEEIFTVAKD